MATYYNRPASQLGVVALFYRSVERVHISMKHDSHGSEGSYPVGGGKGGWGIADGRGVRRGARPRAATVGSRIADERGARHGASPELGPGSAYDTDVIG